MVRASRLAEGRRRAVPTEREARLYKEGIANDRRLRALVGKMRQVAAKAVELIVEEATDA